MKARIALTAIVGVCVIFLLSRFTRPSRHTGAIRIARTIFVGPGGRTLTGFFADLPQSVEPRVRHTTDGGPPRCGGGTLLGRLLRHIETTVYGAGRTACPVSDCGGSYSACSTEQCDTPSCTGHFTACADEAGGAFYDGFLTTGGHGCPDAPGYQCDMMTQDCTAELCDNGAGCQPGPTGGTCPLGQYCDANHTCQPVTCYGGGFCRRVLDCDQECGYKQKCDEHGCCTIDLGI